MIKIWTSLKASAARNLSIRALALAGLITLINRFKSKSDIKSLAIAKDIFKEIRESIKVDFEQGVIIANDHIEKELGSFDRKSLEMEKVARLEAINRTISFAQKQFNQYAITKVSHRLRTKQAVLPEIKIKDSINRAWDMDVIIMTRLMIELQRYAAIAALNAANANGKTLYYRHREKVYVVESTTDVALMIDNGILHPNSSAVPFLR